MSGANSGVIRHLPGVDNALAINGLQISSVGISENKDAYLTNVPVQCAETGILNHSAAQAGITNADIHAGKSDETTTEVSSVTVFSASPITATGLLGTTSTSPVVSSLTPPTTPKPQVKRPINKTIASLVFFDLETTGLAHVVGKSNVHITEVSMIAMNRKEFEQSVSTELRDIRIIHKLCMCIRPRTVVSSGAARITGLDNSNLADEQLFDINAATAITSFLERLPKPVCMLAHNGNCYDFPLLKAELRRLSIQLPSDILIADTWKAFRAVGVPVFPPEKKVCKSVKFKNGKVSYALDNLHLYFFNKKPTGSHSSEGDCIALAKVCHRMKDVILTWFDENCTVIDSVVPMW